MMGGKAPVGAGVLPPTSFFDLVITVSIIVAVFPLLGITAALLGIVYTHFVPYSASALDGTSGLDDTTAYFVDFSATSLTTLASWLSSVAPHVTLATMTLVGLPFANRMRELTAACKYEDLPSPTQLSIVIQLLSGSPLAIWDWLPIRSWRVKERPIKGLNALVTIFCLTFLMR
jgi:hypothetical protein